MKVKISLAFISLVLFVVFSILISCNILIGIEMNFYESLKITQSGVLAFTIITAVGSTYGITLICLCLFSTKFKYALQVSATAAISAIINALIKLCFRRIRPDVISYDSSGGFSFPSGHTQTTVAVFTAIILITVANIKNKVFKTIVIVICIAIPIVVGFSRIYLGAHYLGDVLGGLFLGVFIALSVDIFWQKSFDRANQKIMQF